MNRTVPTSWAQKKKSVPKKSKTFFPLKLHAFEVRKTHTALKIHDPLKFDQSEDVWGGFWFFFSLFSNRFVLFAVHWIVYVKTNMEHSTVTEEKNTVENTFPPFFTSSGKWIMYLIKKIPGKWVRIIQLHPKLSNEQQENTQTYTFTKVEKIPIHPSEQIFHSLLWKVENLENGGNGFSTWKKKSGAVGPYHTLCTLNYQTNSNRTHRHARLQK